MPADARYAYQGYSQSHDSVSTGTPQRTGYENNTVNDSNSSHPTSVISLRIPEEFRIDPPVRIVSTATPYNASGSIQSVGLELEKTLIDRPKSFVQAFLKEFNGRLDPTTSSILATSGGDRVTASLAAAYARVTGSSEAEANAFNANLQTLTAELGFETKLAAGALARHQNRMDHASDTCCSCAAVSSSSLQAA